MTSETWSTGTPALEIASLIHFAPKSCALTEDKDPQKEPKSNYKSKCFIIFVQYKGT